MHFGMFWVQLVTSHIYIHMSSETMETLSVCLLLNVIISLSISDKRLQDCESQLWYLITAWLEFTTPHRCERIPSFYWALSVVFCLQSFSIGLGLFLCNKWRLSVNCRIPIILLSLSQKYTLTKRTRILTHWKYLREAVVPSNIYSCHGSPLPSYLLIYCCSTRLTGSETGIFNVDETRWQAAPEAVYPVILTGWPQTFSGNGFIVLDVIFICVVHEELC